MSLAISKNLYDEDIRLTTFDNKWQSTVIQPETLAKEGFYYKDGIDNVECAFCKLGLNEFEENDDIQELHRKYSPNCSFIRNKNRTSGPLNGEDACGFQKKTQPINKGYTYGWYKNVQTRINSFANWPNLMPQRPDTLASAGFFYSGSGDQCICFYCGLGLTCWETDDDPFVEHAKYSPTCEYLIAKKGLKFIEQCQMEKEENAANGINKTGNEKSKGATKDDERNDDEETQKEPICKVCYKEVANMAIIPCGHVFCVDCVTQLTNCALCRKEIDSISKIYL